MATNDFIHKEDIGAIFRLTVLDQDEAVVDISTATLMQIKFKDPAGTITTETATHTTDGTDGKMEWVTTATGDLHTAGPWSHMGYVEIGASDKFHVEEQRFLVNPILE